MTNQTRPYATIDVPSIRRVWILFGVVALPNKPAPT
jgi:hypothetical protein